VSHQQQREFCARVREKYPDSFEGKLVLDIGALDVNGTNKSLFDACLYIGVDVASGPNVDIVSVGHELALPDETFDTIISTECFEHDRYYALTLKNIFRLLKPGGLFLFTCATTGRPEHGTRSAAPRDAPLLSAFGTWSDYYKNLTEPDIREVLDVAGGFPQHEFLVNESSHDLYFYGVKRGEPKVRRDYSFLEGDRRSVQLYLDTGAGFSEEESQLQRLICDPAHPTGSHEVRFDLSGRVGLRGVRFDPLDRSAVVEIETLSLLADGKELDLIPRIRTNAIVLEGRRGFFKSEDPQIYAEARDPAEFAGASELVARLRYPESGPRAALLSDLAGLRSELALARASAAAERKESADALAQSRAALAEATAEAGRARVEIATLSREAVEARSTAQAELSQARAALAGARSTAQAELSEAKAALVEARSTAQAELSEARAALVEARALVTNARRDGAAALSEQRAELQRARADLASAQAELGRSRAEARHLRAVSDGQRSMLELVQASTSWRLTTPLRQVRRVLHDRFPRFGTFDLVPDGPIERVPGREDGLWRATGAGCHFWLRPHHSLEMSRGQWFTLQYELETSGRAVQQLFIDCGAGCQGHVSLKVAVESPGTVRIPIFLPRAFKGLRLDPMTGPGDFAIRRARMVHSRKPLRGTAEQDRLNSYLQGIDELGFDMAPIAELSFDPSREMQWQALGDDPAFLLHFHGQPEALGGWCRAEVRVSSEEDHGLAKFYFDTGQGFGESETLSISYASGELVERIFRIARPILSLRFDPQAAPGAFRIEALCFTPIPEEEALAGMAARLGQRHRDYRGKATGDVLALVRQLARVEKVPVVDTLVRLCAETYPLLSTSIDYGAWIQKVERPNLPAPGAVAAHLAELGRRPLISVVIPVHDTPEGFLRACIDSVLAQSYPHWELCIADDASRLPAIRRVLDEYRQRDPRIRVTYRTENGHIALASNTALDLARGEYIALLDHDDTLAADALYFVACAIDAQPDVQVIYSDEDKLDASDQRFDPHFKSDWNPDLFFSQNYVSHLGVYRRDLIARIGGFRPGVGGSQDQDLLLRCLPHLRPDQIAHIPRILYHWRSVEGSTAHAPDAKSYTSEAGMKSLRDYFASIGRKVNVERGLLPNTYHVQYEIPDPAPLVSLLVPTRDGLQFLRVCVESILEKTTYPNYEVLIIDNGSVEPSTLEFFRQIQRRDDRVRVLRYDHPFNYSAINNFGVTQARGEIIGLVNDDTEVIAPDWLTEMVRHARRPEIGCVGAKLYYGDGTLQHGGVILGLGGIAGHSHKHFPEGHPGYFARLVLTQNLSAVTAACVLVRKAVYQEVGGLDEENLKIAFNDVDFCLKVLEAGYRNLWTPYAELYHHESVSRGAEDDPAKLARFNGEAAYMRKKWGSTLDNDPFYSPNLTREREDFSISSHRPALAASRHSGRRLSQAEQEVEEASGQPAGAARREECSVRG
jgi:glycosyltransferase involved in cell wall biosynthesis/SAM-dependent methyltransferase